MPPKQTLSVQSDSHETEIITAFISSGTQIFIPASEKKVMVVWRKKKKKAYEAYEDILGKELALGTRMAER